MKQKSRKAPNENASIQRSIMFRIVLGTRPKIRVTKKLMNGVQEGKALKIILICYHVNYSNTIAKKMIMFRTIQILVNMQKYTR